MKIWNRVAARWRNLPWNRPKPVSPATSQNDPGDEHLALARESLRDLIADRRLPAAVRDTLSADYEELDAMLQKLEHGHIHIAAFGRVSTGKSSLLNSLVGEQRFSVSALHGETKTQAMTAWHGERRQGVYLIDTPGINEIDGDAREQLAREVAGQSDLVLFVVDGDISHAEMEALRDLAEMNRPLVLVLNKSDRYSCEELVSLKETLAIRSAGIVEHANIVAAAAAPGPKLFLVSDASGVEREEQQHGEPDIEALRERLWEILQAEGKSLSAINAGLFASAFSDRLGRRILEVRRHLANRMITTYCVAKGVAVAVNPIPVADLLAAAFVDLGMIVHLSRIYGLPLTTTEAGRLAAVVMTQLVALMGTVWAVNFVSSALKLGTAGLSTLVTAGAQGAVAYYSTYVVGRVAEEYFALGCSWGDGGPKQVVQEILDGLDRESIMAQGKEKVMARLKRKAGEGAG